MTESVDASLAGDIVKQGQLLIQQGQLAQAAALLDAHLSDHPGDGEAMYCMAVCLRKQEKFADALTMIEQVIDQAFGHGRAFQERGYIQLAMGRPALAIADLEKAVTQNPALFGSWRALAQVPGYAKREEAQQHLAWLTSLPPELVSVASLMHQNKLYQAEQLCRDFLKRQPHHPEAMRLLAELGSKFHILDDAEFLLASCLEFEPNFRRARLDYVQVLQKRQKFDKALEQAQILLASDPDNPNFKICLGNAQQAIGDFEAAIASFEDVLKLKPDHFQLHLTLGHAFKTMGRVDDAISSYRRAYRVKPDYGDAYWSLANLKTYRFSADERGKMRQYEADSATDVDDRVHLCFALGKDLEDAGQFEESFAYYLRGNNLRHQQDRFDIDRMDAGLDLQKALFDKAFFQRHAQTGCPAADPIFIVGLPRAGSTLLEQILSSHSQVDGTMELSNIVALAHRLNGRKVLQDRPLYPGILQDLSPEALMKMGEAYIEETRHHRQGAPFFIDKMPNNFRHIALIHLILPNAKIIDARRHPMACGFSVFKQLFAEGQQFSYRLDDIGRYYRSYVEIMEHWNQVLPGRVLRVHHEDVIADLETQVRRILDYCGLPFEQSCVDFHKTQRAVRTPSAEQVRQPIYQSAMEHWVHYEAFLEPLKNALGPSLKNYR